VIDIPCVPKRFENRVGEAQHQNVLRRLLSEEVVNAVCLLFGERIADDAIQFARYAPMVKAREARVIVEVHRELLTLARTIAGVDQVQGYLFALPCPASELDFFALERNGRTFEAA